MPDCGFTGWLRAAIRTDPSVRGEPVATREYFPQDVGKACGSEHDG